MRKRQTGVQRFLRSTYGKIALVLILLLVAFRLILPFGLENYINNKIKGIEGYYGSVEDVDLAFLRNVYQVENIRIIADSSKIKEPFFQAESLKVTFNWTDLFKGGLSGSGTLYSPTVNYVQGKKPQETQAPSDAKPFTDILREMVPFRVDVFKVKNGEFTYVNRLKAIDYGFYATKIYGNMQNLTNSQKLSSSMYATAQFIAQVMDSGDLKIDLLVNPLDSTPKFKLDGVLKNLQLVNLNDYLKAQTSLTFRSGILDFTTDLNSGGKQVNGFAVMDIKYLEMASAEELLKSDESLSKKFLEGLSEAGSELLENSNDRVRVKVPVSAPVKKGKPDMVAAIIHAMRVSFVDSFIARLFPLASP